MSINITEGAGKVVASETISAAEYGLVKLVDATATSTTRTGVAANPLQVSIANTAANSTAIKVDGSAVTQPVSGTITANLGPTTIGGLTTFHLASAGSTNATVVKNSAGQLYGWYIYNSNAAARKIAFHNASSTPTAGASIYFTLMIPALGGANVEFSQGLVFSTGISITTVTGLADNDTTGVASNDLIINLWYK